VECHDGGANSHASIGRQFRINLASHTLANSAQFYLRDKKGKTVFELTAASTFIDVLQKAFSLLTKYRKQKHQFFTEIVEPIYAELATVVGQYYEVFRNFRDELEQKNFDEFDQIMRQKKRERETIILARNKVLGLTAPFLDEQYDVLSKDKFHRFDEMLYDFARGIKDFFFASDDLGQSGASSLFLFIEDCIANRRESAKGEILKDIEESLRYMEVAWQHISGAYGELRVYCLAR
jgi:hypothetical protein